MALSMRAALGPSSGEVLAVMMVPSARLYGRAGHILGLGAVAGGGYGAAIVEIYAGLIEQQGYLVDFGIVALA